MSPAPPPTPCTPDLLPGATWQRAARGGGAAGFRKRWGVRSRAWCVLQSVRPDPIACKHVCREQKAPCPSASDCWACCALAYVSRRAALPPQHCQLRRVPSHLPKEGQSAANHGHADGRHVRQGLGADEGSSHDEWCEAKRSRHRGGARELPGEPAAGGRRRRWRFRTRSPPSSAVLHKCRRGAAHPNPSIPHTT